MADLSQCDLTGANATGAIFERAALTRCRIERFSADRAIFRFADLRQARIQEASFVQSNFVGTTFAGTEARECDFREADFYWTELENFAMTRCNTEGARFPEGAQNSYGPSGGKVPEVKAAPVYRLAATAEDRQALLAAVSEAMSSSHENTDV
jgi:uncharacterized protein YjbI with pentapeptide repeats